MKVVVAPNAFKGSLRAGEAAAAMADAIVRVMPNAEVVRVPVADGGDGLVDVALEALGGEARTVTVSGPLGRPVAARFCHVPAMAFAAIEMPSPAAWRYCLRSNATPPEPPPAAPAS